MVSSGSAVSQKAVRTDAEISAAVSLVWEFFDFLRNRDPDLGEEHDRYIAEQDVAGGLGDFRNCLPPASR